MPTTQLFVELLVIGLGAIAWLVLSVAAAFGWPLSPNQATFGAAELAAVTGIAYVLGIMMDRAARTLWGALIFRPDHIRGTPTHDAELMICCQSERLWNTCAYNRSRLRICRAWTLNFALLAAGYALWTARVQTHPWPHSAVVILVALMLCALGTWVTVRLNRDYYIQIEAVFRLLPYCSSHVPTAKTPVSSTGQHNDAPQAHSAGPTPCSSP